MDFSSDNFGSDSNIEEPEQEQEQASNLNLQYSEATMLWTSIDDWNESCESMLCMGIYATEDNSFKHLLSCLVKPLAGADEADDADDFLFHCGPTHIKSASASRTER